jgi:hypothetical protein
LRTEFVLEKALREKNKDLAKKIIKNSSVISPRFVHVILTKIYDDEWEHDDITVLYWKVEKYDRDDVRNIMVRKAWYTARMDNLWLVTEESDADYEDWDFEE